jgi:ribosome biogenesis GTPase
LTHGAALGSRADVDLASLGWNDFFARAFDQYRKGGRFPARVASEHKHAYLMLTEKGEFMGAVLGRLLKGGPRSALPAVGDWVVVEKRPGEPLLDIHFVLPRRTSFLRRAAGRREEEQVVAANLDTVFLVNGLDADFNPRRMERYLTLAEASGAQPVVLLNKSDVCGDVDTRTELARTVAGTVPVHAVSAVSGEGMASLAPYLAAGKTIALLGSSGVGKSTLVNWLLGRERQAVGTVRDEDGKGRHTTTRRELILLPEGALLIDTPGLREIQLWTHARECLGVVFPEILAAAGKCRFRNCRHESEPGCRVRAAVQEGSLPEARFAAFCKLRAELENLDKVVSGARKHYGPKLKGRRIMRG